MNNELRRLECKRRVQQRLEEVITACNKGDTEELKSLMVSSLMTEDEFNTLCKGDGELINDEGMFLCNGYTFQISQDFAYSALEPTPTDRYIIWGFAKYSAEENIEENIVDIVYWTWGSPFIGDKIIDSVLEKCKDWTIRAKKQGHESYMEESWIK